MRRNSDIDYMSTKSQISFNLRAIIRMLK